MGLSKGDGSCAHGEATSSAGLSPLRVSLGGSVWLEMDKSTCRPHSGLPLVRALLHRKAAETKKCGLKSGGWNFFLFYNLHTRPTDSAVQHLAVNVWRFAMTGLLLNC
jgi:hypothetical protein